jgi:protein SCO1
MRRCADLAAPCGSRGADVSPALRALLCAALLAAAQPVARAASLSEAAAEPGTVATLDERDALRLGQEAIGRRVPELALLDTEGRPVTLSAYAGKPLVVSFIYTGCFQICPAQTRKLHEAVKGLQRMVGPRQFNVVSIGFNQPFDDPGAMRSFARQHRIDEPNWAFLSPPRDVADSLTRAFGFAHVATPAGFDHVLGVTVVDAQGRIHAQVYGDAPWPAATSALAAAVERVRILCTVYDPDTGEYRYDWKLILELIGGAMFFGAASVYLLLEWRHRRRARERPCPPSNASGSMA